jgi:transcriptional regulator, XRE family
MTILKELRKSRKLLQKDLARYLQVAESTYSYWEQGKFEPDTETLKKLADYFDVSVDYLLGRAENKETATTENLFKIKKAPESLSEDEQELLKQYKGLDSHSKAALLELAKNLNINKSNINKSNTERKIK